MLMASGAWEFGWAQQGWLLFAPQGLRPQLGRSQGWEAARSRGLESGGPVHAHGWQLVWLLVVSSARPYTWPLHMPWAPSHAAWQPQDG